MLEMLLQSCVMLMCCAFSFIMCLVHEFSFSFADSSLCLGDVQAFGLGGRLLWSRIVLRWI